MEQEEEEEEEKENDNNKDDESNKSDEKKYVTTLKDLLDKYNINGEISCVITIPGIKPFQTILN